MFYIHVQFTGGFEMDAIDEADIKKKIKNMSLPDLLDKCDKPVYSIKIGRLVGLEAPGGSSKRRSKT